MASKNTVVHRAVGYRIPVISAPVRRCYAHLAGVAQSVLVRRGETGGQVGEKIDRRRHGAVDESGQIGDSRRTAPADHHNADQCRVGGLVQLGLQSGHRGSPLRGRCRNSLASRAGVVAIRGNEQFDLAYGDRGIKGAMRAADRSGARIALVAGDRDIEAGTVGVKDLSTGDQVDVAIGSVVGEVVSRLT